MRVKIVTAYWMGLSDTKFQGVPNIRKQRYLGSLIAHCKNLGLPIICYTRNENLDEVQQIKDEHNLSNLEIKILELSDVKLHNKINEVRERNFNKDLCGRGPEIMWGKFDIVEKELDNCDQVFWLDCGIQHPGIFPWRYSKKYFNLEDHPVVGDWWNQLDVFNFGKIFNETLFNKIIDITKNKIILLTSTSPQVSYPIELVKHSNNLISSPYPIGGLIGGDVKIFKKFIDSFWKMAEFSLEKEILCTEEVLMKFAYDDLNVDETINFNFTSYYINHHDEFHFNMWDINSNHPKPLYMVWHDIINN
jgi:hypothetical protein